MTINQLIQRLTEIRVANGGSDLPVVVTHDRDRLRDQRSCGTITVIAADKHYRVPLNSQDCPMLERTLVVIVH